MTQTPAALCTQLTELIATHYVITERIPAITTALNNAELSGTPTELAAMFTTTLQESSNDLHLKVRPQPTPTHHRQPTTHLPSGGIRTVERITDRTGVLTIAPYLAAADVAEPHLQAAFRLLTGINQLLIDVRTGHGGTPETVSLLCGYLLGNEPVHLQNVLHRDGTIRHFWTTPSHHRITTDTKVAVLTSAQTFSACEELAYNLQVLGRARIVGEQTAGGAHPVRIFPLGEALTAAIPVARSVNVHTGTNWEGTGVVPDVPCCAPDAVAVALAVLAAAT